MQFNELDFYQSIIFYWSVYGNVVVGPTFEDSASRARPESDAGTIRRLVRLGESCVPGLEGCPIVNTYTGVRPATETKDYHIDSYPERCGVLLYKNLETSLKKLNILRTVNFLYFQMNQVMRA